MTAQIIEAVRCWSSCKMKKNQKIFIKIKQKKPVCYTNNELELSQKNSEDDNNLTTEEANVK